jgi:hypothetical protein
MRRMGVSKVSVVGVWCLYFVWLWFLATTPMACAHRRQDRAPRRMPLGRPAPCPEPMADPSKIG